LKYTDEKYINHKKAQTYFRDNLSKYFINNIPDNIFNSFDSIKEYLNLDNDITILNCTYNHLNPIEYDKYELFLSLIYKIDNIDIFAITLMDGPFFSIYPYDIENKLYTITSVEHGVVYTDKHVKDYRIEPQVLNEKILKIECLLDRFIENWRTYCTYVDYNLSWKTKPISQSDDRSVRIERQGNIINIYGGKITGIFVAEKYILNDLKLNQSLIIQYQY
jgi:hypothetical protein